MLNPEVQQICDMADSFAKSNIYLNVSKRGADFFFTTLIRARFPTTVSPSDRPPAELPNAWTHKTSERCLRLHLGISEHHTDLLTNLIDKEDRIGLLPKSACEAPETSNALKPHARRPSPLQSRREVPALRPTTTIKSTPPLRASISQISNAAPTG